MKNKIAITAFGSFSALGTNETSVWQNYLQPTTLITNQTIGNYKIPVCTIQNLQQEQINQLLQENQKYKLLDKSVLFAILASRQAIKNANWQQKKEIGINIGSSRGATGLFEKHYSHFLNHHTTVTTTSPTTTLGNIATSVAHDLQTTGPAFSHSITCASALHALLNGIAWLQAGFCNSFLVGGSEAPITPFTVSQMQALKIYSKLNNEYPCQSFNLDKKNNTMVLGEGAAMLCLDNNTKNAIAYIDGVGYAIETIENSTSISTEGTGFQKTMQMAIGSNNLSDIDAIVMHTPGTIKGDKSEFNAIKKVFGNQLPLLTTNKWKIGHTFGASGMFSIELALLMLQHDYFIGIPYLGQENKSKKMNKILVNAIGFGGNAVSVLLTKTP